MITVLGIDPSLTATTYCRLAEKTHSFGTITTKLKGVERLLFIEEQLWKAITVDRLDLICLEDYAFARPNQAHQIGELGGTIRKLLHQSGIPWVAIAPSSIKKFSTGKGNVEKNKVLMHVYKRWGVECANDNQADAYVLAKVAWELMQPGGDLTAFQEQAMINVRERWETNG